jgi:hypothetical protein
MIIKIHLILKSNKRKSKNRERNKLYLRSKKMRMMMINSCSNHRLNKKLLCSNHLPNKRNQLS